MSSSDRTGSWRTASMGSHASANTKETAGLSSAFLSNHNNPLMGNPALSEKKLLLRPLAVRERSKAVPNCQELKNTKDPYGSVLSFLILPNDSNSSEESKSDDSSNSMPLRINVFCETGTIGTAKVLDGTLRQTFRRNVTSLDVLERLLRHPEGPVEINDQLIGVTDGHSERIAQKGEVSVAGLEKGVELADVGMAILEGEREKLAKHLKHLDDEAEQAAEEAEKYARKQKQAQQELLKQQQREEQQQRQAAALEKQQSSKPPKPPKGSSDSVVSDESQPTGELQAQMLHKAMNDSGSTGEKNDSKRIGRRRNKLNNLRKNRNLNISKKHLLGTQSDHDGGGGLNKTKRRGGKQSSRSSKPIGSNSHHSAPGNAAIVEAKRSGSNKKNRRSSATKITTITANTGGGTTVDSADAESNASSMMSASDYNKKVNPSNATAFKNCGYEFHFKLPAEVMNQVDQCLRDIAKMNKVVKGVATNGRGTVFLYGNGGVAYTPAIPKALYQKLRQLRSSSFSSRPCFVALGTRDRYYVGFNDGSGDWKGSNSLDKMLKKRVLKNPTGGNTSGMKKTLSSGSSHGQKHNYNKDDPMALLPRSVAFGATYDTFFVVFHDGSWEYQGRSIPKSLEKKLAERDDAADLVICNLGPNGEWFMKAENGKMWWSGITPELDVVLKKITKQGFLHNMDFGENGSYFVSYDEE